MTPDQGRDDDTQDRRGLERRVDQLERRYETLSVLVNDVKSEQKHHSEIMMLSFKGVEARCVTLSAENILNGEKFDKLKEVVLEAIGDATKSPLGRELMKEIISLTKGRDDLRVALAVISDRCGTLEEIAAEGRGAVNLVRYSKIGSILIAMMGLIVLLGLALKALLTVKP